MRTSLAKKGSRFAENVEVCLGDLDPDHAPGDERVSASAPPASKRRRGGNIHSPVTPSSCVSGQPLRGTMHDMPMHERVPAQ